MIVNNQLGVDVFLLWHIIANKTANNFTSKCLVAYYHILFSLCTDLLYRYFHVFNYNRSYIFRSSQISKVLKKFFRFLNCSLCHPCMKCHFKFVMHFILFSKLQHVVGNFIEFHIVFFKELSKVS